MSARLLILASLVSVTSACSLALDTDVFRDVVSAGPDAGRSDAGAPDAGPADAGVALRVDAHAPEALLEGVGAIAGVRGTAVVVFGEGLFVDEVRATGLEVRDFRASADGTVLGVHVGVPVNRARGEGDEAEVVLELVRGGVATPVRLTVQGLDERTVRAGDLAPTDAFPPPYSELRFEGVRFDGLSEVRWYATSLIQVDGSLRVDGLSDGTPGPGACAGGAADRAAACARGGDPGLAGAAPSGGGGGGNRTSGLAGQTAPGGPAPGAGGGTADSEVIVDGLREQAGAGGGGGGGVTSGGGGGGGGALALVSRGPLVLGDVDARGGPGAPLSGDCTSAGGGGGSGGVVLLRGWSLEGAGQVDVRGGRGGGVTGCDNRGGAGGDGFVYVQSATVAEGVRFVPEDADRRSPAWAEDTPVIVTQRARLAVRGAGAFHLQVEGGEAQASIVPSGGRAEVDIDLGAPGIKQVCLRRTADAVEAIEGRACLAFAVVP